MVTFPLISSPQKTVTFGPNESLLEQNAVFKYEQSYLIVLRKYVHLAKLLFIFGFVNNGHLHAL